MERTGDMIVLKMPESIKKISNKKKNRSGLRVKKLSNHSCFIHNKLDS